MSYGGYQDQQNPYGHSNPYASAPNAEAGYGQAHGQGQEQHEMRTYPQQGHSGQQSHNSEQAYDAHAVSSGYGGGPQDFWDKRKATSAEITTLDAKLNEIEQIQGEIQRAFDPTQGRTVLDAKVHEFRLMLSRVNSQLQELKDLVDDGPKLRQVKAVSESLKQVTARWQHLDAQFRQSTRNEIERQYRIVNPSATQAEVDGVVEQGVEGGVFQQALRQERTGQARAVLGNVQARHNEILQIEKQMTELAMLFQDLDTMVIQQDAVIQNAEQQTEQTNIHIGKGTEEVDKGIVHARRARRNKWICLGITVLIILIAVAVGVGVGLTQNPPKSS